MKTKAEKWLIKMYSESLIHENLKDLSEMCQGYSDQENIRLTAIVSKQDELVVILKALPVAVGKRSVELWEKFTELESELEKLKAE